jgi:hypothetical protein
LLTPTMKIKRTTVADHDRDWVEAYLNSAAVVWEH